MRQRRVKRTNRKPSFFWQGVLILAPMLVLAKLGALALSQDKRMAQHQAEVRAQELAELNVKSVAEALLSDQHFSAISAMNARITNMPALVWDAFTARYFGRASPSESIPMPQGTIIVVDGNGELTLPVLCEETPRPEPLELGQLTASQSNAWVLAQSTTNPRAAITTYENFLSSGVTARFAQNAKLELARLLAGQGDQAVAIALCRGLITETNLDSTESGVAVAAVASGLLLRISDDAVSIVASNAVRRPSSLTSPLLAELMSRGETNPATRAVVSGWMAVWINDELGRNLYRAARPFFETNTAISPPSGGATNTIALAFTPSVTPRRLFGTLPLPFSATNGSFVYEAGEAVLTTRIDMPAGHVLLCRSRTHTMSLLESVITSSDGMDFTVQVGGVELRGTNRLEALAFRSAGKGGGQTMQRVHHILAPERMAEARRVIDGTPIIVTAYFVAPDVFFRQQEERAFLFKLVIGAAALTSVVGFFFAWRAFRKQLRLAEMKSNFVSSVSHELRAPIASVRLMAEGLERGKISDPAKQREYFRFITQECRRLSAMIENVLDFARIEQGRKEYEFEPTDVNALVATTVKLMEPYAEERGVLLKVPPASRREGTPENPWPLVESSDVGKSEAPTRQDAGGTLLDGQAIQQALVNLIDNAIKHSSSGSEVTVSLEIPNPQS